MKVIKKWLSRYDICLGILYLMIGTQISRAQEGEVYESIGGNAPDMNSFNVSEYLTAPNQVLPTNIAEVIVRLINQLSLVIGSFALLTIIVGAMSLLTSAGREQPLTRGKDMIKFAIIGLVVAFGAYFITAFVQSIFYDV